MLALTLRHVVSDLQTGKVPVLDSFGKLKYTLHNAFRALPMTTVEGKLQPKSRFRSSLMSTSEAVRTLKDS